jgi:hypothetical protein
MQLGIISMLINGGPLMMMMMMMMMGWLLCACAFNLVGMQSVKTVWQATQYCGAAVMQAGTLA